MPYLMVALSYFIGAIPFGYLIARAAGSGDIRTRGSGNIGATNVVRSVGKGAGALTFLLDFLKGTIMVLVTMRFAGNTAAVCAAVAAVVGHNFPIYLRFKGGRGVAVGAGVFMALSPKAVCLVLLIFIIVVLSVRIVSVASLTASAAFPVLAWYFGSGIPVVLGGIGVVALIFVRHGANIIRLFHGEEHRFRLSRSK